MKPINTQRPQNTMLRLKRPDLPKSQEVYMGPPVGNDATPVASGDRSAQEKALAKQVADLRAQLSQSDTAHTARLAEAQKEIQAAKDELHEAQTAVKNSEESLALALEEQKKLDSVALPDKVWVTAIQERTNDNGNAVVTCTLHFGDDADAVDGTIYIPTTEIGKLKPPRTADAG